MRKANRLAVVSAGKVAALGDDNIMANMPFSPFFSWSLKERRTFAVFLIAVVAILYIVIAVHIYRMMVGQKDLLAEIGSIASGGLQTARFDAGQDPKTRKLCFLEGDPTALRFLGEKLSLVEAKRGPDHTLVVMEFTVTFSTSKSQQRQFAAEVYSKAPEDVFLRNHPYGDASITRENPESFSVRIPGLSSWVAQKFHEHGCRPR